MASIEWVQRRLENWARWSAERAGTSLGYPRATAFTRAAAAPRHAEARNSFPVNSIEAARTEEAVQQLRFIRGILHAAVTWHYVRGLDGADLAAALGRISRKRAYQLIEEAQFELAPLLRRQDRKSTGIAAKE